jgi:hypothetical protein
MASFTDKISQFNPYIQQLPAQEMQQVGMYKQQQYDQGVQKIQGYIDNVAGMDVMNDADKQYLQSKLNDLGSKLRTVAAGDFSNHQLVNSVGGMATSIVKDPTIQTAVASTQRARTELATAEDLYRQGKSSINNVNYLKGQVNQYLNSKTAGTSFTGKYINYVDLNKKWMDLADNLKKNAPDSSIDNPYKTDANGNTLYYKTDAKGNVTQASGPQDGQPVLSDAMKRISVKGVSAQSLYDSFKASLTSDDEQQMKVDAWAHYQGKGPNSVIEDYSIATQQAKNSLVGGINQLKVMLLTSPNLTQPEKLDIQANINKYQNKLNSGDLDKELAQSIADLQDPRNLETAQYNAYVRKTLNGQAVMLANQSKSEAILANPYEAANHARQVLQESIREHNLTYNIAKSNLALSEQRLRDDELKTKMEFEWRDKEYKAKYPGIVTVDRAISSNIVVPTIGSLETTISKLDESKNLLNSDYGKKLNLDKEGLDDLYSKYRINPTAVTGNDELQYAQRRDYFERQVAQKNNVKNLVAEGSKKFDKQIDDALVKGNIKGVIGGDGKELVSAKTLYDTNDIIKRNTKMVPQMGSSLSGYAPQSYTSAIDEATVLKQVGNDPQKRAVAIAMIKKIKGDSSITPTERIIADQATAVTRTMSTVGNKIAKDKFDYETQTIAKLDPSYQEQVGTIDPKNEHDMSILGNLIGNTIDTYNTLGKLDLSGGAKYDPDTLAGMRSASGKAKEDITSSIIKRPDGSALIVINQGTKSQTIPVSAKDFGRYFPDYAKSNPFNEDIHAIDASPYGTTNMGPGNGRTSADGVNAAHSGYELPLLQNTPWASKVRYDIVGDKGDDGMSNGYAVRLFVNKNGIWIPADTKGGYRNAATIQNYLQNELGTQTIEDILKTNK